MQLFYNIIIRTYGLILWLASFVHPKARKWIAGRVGWREQLRNFRNTIGEQEPVVWIHCASLGEFEQGRPVIEDLKKQHPAVKVLLTFFSPSGFEIRKNFQQADLVMYLPLDTPANSRQFLQIARPIVTIFVKYEFWYHFISQAGAVSSLTILVSATFRPRQPFFRWYGGIFRHMIRKFDAIFVQEQKSADLLASIGYQRAILAGDNRVDRVSRLAGTARVIPEALQFRGNSPLFIAGSTWPADEKVLIPFLTHHLPPEWKLILAPHHLDQGHIRNLRNELPQPCVLFSEAEQSNLQTARSLIIDNIGMLSSLYQYGKIAYIGGGFGAGIHNLLEPMTFGLPVFFGPNHEKFREANLVKAAGGGFPIERPEDLVVAFSSLLTKEAYSRSAEACKAFIGENMGATESVLKFINRSHTLTPP